MALALDADIEAVLAARPADDPRRRVLHRHLDHRAGADEVLTGVTFPVWTGRRGFAVEEFARRHGDFAIAGAGRRGRARRRRHRISRCAIGLFGLGSTPLRERPPGRPRPSARPRGRRSTAGEIGRAAVADLESVPSDLHGSATTASGSGATMVAAGLQASRRGGAAWLTSALRSRSTAAAPGDGGAAADPRRLPARALRPDRHPPRLRARRLRRVHGPARRGGRPLLPHVRRAGRRRRGHHGRGHRRSRRHAVGGAGGVPRAPRAAVRVLHPWLRRLGDRVPARQPRPDRRADPRRPCPGTCAAAPATRGSSRPSAARPARSRLPPSPPTRSIRERGN